MDYDCILVTHLPLTAKPTITIGNTLDNPIGHSIDYTIDYTIDNHRSPSATTVKRS